MKMIVLSLAATLSLGFAGCKKAEKPKEAPKPPQAQQQPAPKPTEPPKPNTPPIPAGTATGALQAGKYAVDNGHSAVIFKAKHMGAGYTYAWFKEFDGSFTVDADPAKSSVELTVKTESVDTRVPKRDNHLRSPDFFNAAQFPTATFKSTKVEKAADGWNVTGDFTLRGKTKSVMAKVTPVGNGKNPMGKVLGGFEGKLTLNRNDFDVKFMPGALGDDVELTLSLEGVLQQ